MKQTATALLILLQILFLQGCSTEKQELEIHYEFSSASLSNATHSPEQAVIIAQREAASLAYNTNDFPDITVYYEPEDETEWWIFFMHKV